MKAQNLPTKNLAERIPDQAQTPLSKRDIFKASQAFAVESRPQSWWYVGSTFTFLGVTLVGAGTVPWLLLRVVLSVLGALLMVRAFITYHDYLHGAILRKSRVAWILFCLYGAFSLTPARSWRNSHNNHHAHVGETDFDSIGSFPMITTRMWHDISTGKRLAYRTIRHPLVILFGYVFIFAINICLKPLLRNPIKYWDAGVALLTHLGLITLLALVSGFEMVFLVILLPMMLSSAVGSFLFFAQHNYRHVQVFPGDGVSFYQAALESSSYMKLNIIMHWFTGNIGYHHIHHLNIHIPFYRLPETMAAVPELQKVKTISLKLHDIMNCFRSCLWDEDQKRVVSYREAKKILADKKKAALIEVRLSPI